MPSAVVPPLCRANCSIVTIPSTTCCSARSSSTDWTLGSRLWLAEPALIFNRSMGTSSVYGRRPPATSSSSVLMQRTMLAGQCRAKRESLVTDVLSPPSSANNPRPLRSSVTQNPRAARPLELHAILLKAVSVTGYRANVISRNPSIRRMMETKISRCTEEQINGFSSSRARPACRSMPQGVQECQRLQVEGLIRRDERYPFGFATALLLPAIQTRPG
jgi:hypothetical protein